MDDLDSKQVVRPKYKEIVGEALAEKQGAIQKVKEFTEKIKNKELELEEKDKLINNNRAKHSKLATKYSNVINENRSLIKSINYKENNWYKKLNKINKILGTNREKRQEYYKLSMFLKKRLIEMGDQLTSRNTEIVILKRAINSKLVIAIAKCEAFIIRLYRKVVSIITELIIKLKFKIKDVESKYYNSHKK